MTPDRLATAQPAGEIGARRKACGEIGFGPPGGQGGPSPPPAIAGRGETIEHGAANALESPRRDRTAWRILLADDHQVVRQGLEALLEREGFAVVGTASDGLEAVRLAQRLRPDVAVLDLAMPLLNGIAAAREILRGCPEVRPILLTMYTEDSFVLEALRAGIRGYVVKTQMAQDLLTAIHEVAKGRIYLCSVVADTVVQAYLSQGDLPSDSLSPREAQVLQLLAEGKSTKETASLLGISGKTVESHRHRIMTKLDIHDVAGLVRHAIRRGLVQS